MAESTKQVKTKLRPCFVIGPIGEDDSDERLDADWLLDAIVRPVLENPPFSYKVVRADEMPTPGTISFQIITAIIDADLIIADLTHHNPNVFYELAIAHLMEKKTIHIVKQGHEALPFDVHDMRAIIYRREHPNDIEKAKVKLAKQARAVEEPDYKPFSPIAITKAIRAGMTSSDPSEKALTVVMQMFTQLADRMSSLERSQPQKTLAEVLMAQAVSSNTISVTPGGGLGLLDGIGGIGGFGGLANIPPPIDMPQKKISESTVTDILKSRGVPGSIPDPAADRDAPIDLDSGEKDDKK